MTEPESQSERFCASCAHCAQRTENGADWQACTHQPEGAAAPLTPHQQRTAPADQEANFCGIEGVYWGAARMSKSDQQLAYLGAEAAQVLNNPAFNEALRLMREGAYATFKSTSVKDREGLMLVAQAARLTDAVESTLRGILQSGKMAQHRIDIDKARSESKLRRAARAVTGR